MHHCINNKEEIPVNKSELINALADKTELSKKNAEKALNAFVETVSGSLAKGEKVLVFKLKKRKRYHRTKGHRQMLTKIKVTSMPTTRTSASKAASTKDESAKASE